MNKDFITNLMREIDFPNDAIVYLSDCIDTIISKDSENKFDETLEIFYKNDFNWKEISPLLEDLSKKTGIHRYSVDLIFTMACSERLKQKFADEGISDEVFWDTMSDFTCKLHECHDVYGIWGTFVAFWYSIFFRGDLFKLGRLEYENDEYELDKPYEKNGYIVKKGDMVKSIHIPSAGPLTEELCYDSYKKAYEFYKDELNGKPLVCVSHTWLFHPSTREILSPTSNTVRFMNDFDIIDSEDEKEFGERWRVFGKDFELPDEQLPEKTSMQKGYKKWILEKKPFGMAYGILIFDGEKIVNK